MLESIYEKCFVRELSLQNLEFKTQQWVPVSYKRLLMEADLRLDVLVEDLILVELKAIEGLLPVHSAQVLTYMKLLQNPKVF